MYVLIKEGKILAYSNWMFHPDAVATDKEIVRVDEDLYFKGEEPEPEEPEIVPEVV